MNIQKLDKNGGTQRRGQVAAKPGNNSAKMVYATDSVGTRSREANPVENDLASIAHTTEKNLRTSA